MLNDLYFKPWELGATPQALCHIASLAAIPADLVEFCLFEAMKHENKHCKAEKGSPVAEQVIRHTEVPFDGDVSSQEDIKAFWAERERCENKSK